MGANKQERESDTTSNAKRERAEKCIIEEVSRRVAGGRDV